MEKWLDVFKDLFFYFKVDSLTVFLLFIFMVAKNRDLSCPH